MFNHLPGLFSKTPRETERGHYEVDYIDSDGRFKTFFSTTWEKAIEFITNFPPPIPLMANAPKGFPIRSRFVAKPSTDPVPSVDPEPAPTVFKTITDSLASVLTEKNKRYGNSALNPISVFNGKSKVGQRADDKVARIANSPELRKNDVVDLMGYLVLMCKENNWTDFTDQID